MKKTSWQKRFLLLRIKLRKLLKADTKVSIGRTFGFSYAEIQEVHRKLDEISPEFGFTWDQTTEANIETGKNILTTVIIDMFQDEPKVVKKSSKFLIEHKPLVLKKMNKEGQVYETESDVNKSEGSSETYAMRRHLCFTFLVHPDKDNDYMKEPDKNPYTQNKLGSNYGAYKENKKSTTTPYTKFTK